LNATPLEFAMNTAMLDCPAVVAATDSKPKSSNLTPVVSPETASAYPAALGASTAGFDALYVHCDAEQLSPP
jgi:hypothetical protein